MKNLSKSNLKEKYSPSRWEGIKVWVGIILIIFFAFIFRISKLDQIPPSPNWDEVSIGYNAYSILQTGRDEWGIKLPSVFRAYGDYKLPGYIYALVPLIKLFSLNTFSVRLLSVIAGTVSVYIFYLICDQLFPHKKPLQLIGTAIFAFSPWSIFLSRIALEANLGLCLFLVSLYFLITRQYWQSSLFYGLYLFSYNSSRVLLPFYLIALIFLIIKNKYPLSKKCFGFAPLLILVGLFIFQSLTQNATDRYKWVTLLDSGAINQINELQTKYGRLVVNKATYLGFRISQNYLLHFDPSYLFWHGGSQYQFSLPNFNLINCFFLPFFWLGLFLIIKTNPLILFFLLVSPLPSAITRDAPHLLRGLNFLPLATISIIYGLDLLSKNLKNRTVFYISLIFVVGNLSIFAIKYQQYALDYASSWQYGNREMAEFINQNYSHYQRIFITKKYGEPHEFILFNNLYSPLEYQTKPKDWNFHADWYWVDNFDKFYFLNDWEIKSQQFTTGDLLISSPQNYPSTGAHLLTTINSPTFQAIYDIISYSTNDN